MVLKLIDRYPVIIYAGGALLGYVAGEMLVAEELFNTLVGAWHYLHWVIPVLCALLVVMSGMWLAARRAVSIAATDLLDEKVGSQSQGEE